MVRLTKKVLAWKRKEAARMERQGSTAREIRDAMKIENIATVQKWLRAERGPRKAAKPHVLKLLDTNMSFTEIANAADCSVENVRKIEREKRGHLKRRTRTGQELLQDYLSDPARKKNDRYTRYGSFGQALIAHCNQLTNTNPRAAKEIIELTIDQFSLMLQHAKATQKIRAITCNLIQATAIKAARERALDRLESALGILRSLLNFGSTCPFCIADLARREALVLRDLGRLHEALEKLEIAKGIYRDTGKSGHDAFGDGLGSCILVETTIYREMGMYADAIRIANFGLRGVPESNSELHTRISGNDDSSAIASVKPVDKSMWTGA